LNIKNIVSIAHININNRLLMINRFESKKTSFEILRGYQQYVRVLILAQISAESKYNSPERV
tara:strand:+ start:352 stop:537 length:186 start_codon:yes stop_codon:yes gene_type:complete